MQGSFLFMGTGGSMGIPVIGCHCHVCKSSFPKDRRLRASGLIKVNNKILLLDCGPDFRQQALTHHIDHLDGVLVTHAHNDHTAGLDDLRALYMRNRTAMPCLMSEMTSRDTIDRFKYVFTPAEGEARLTPKIDLKILKEKRGDLVFEGVPLHYFTFVQAGMEVNGFRLGNFAYVSDIHDYEETIFEDLKGVEILVLSALRFTPSHLHLSVDQAVDFANRVGAQKVWLTHLSHDLEHESTNAYLPEHIRLAYDGLQLSFQGWS